MPDMAEILDEIPLGLFIRMGVFAIFLQIVSEISSETLKILLLFI